MTPVAGTSTCCLWGGGEWGCRVPDLCQGRLPPWRCPQARLGPGACCHPPGCDSPVHVLEKGKEAEGWNIDTHTELSSGGCHGDAAPQNPASSCRTAVQPAVLQRHPHDSPVLCPPPGTCLQILLGEDVLLLWLTRASASHLGLPVAGSGMSWDL